MAARQYRTTLNGSTHLLLLLLLLIGVLVVEDARSEFSRLDH